MPITLRTLFGLSVLLACVGLLIWWFWTALKRSDDPTRFLMKWLLTGLLGYLFLRAATSGPYGILAAILIGTVAGLIWASSWGGALGDLFGNLYTGGSTEMEAAPLYSIAEAQRKRGRYLEAIAAIHDQLSRFPDDFQGQMMLAAIQAEDLKQVIEAQETIHSMVLQPRQKPQNISYALNRLADWHLQISADRAAAEDALRQIQELLPDTEFARLAAQRLAHLTPDAMLADRKERRRFSIPSHSAAAEAEASPSDPFVKAGELIEHLRAYPDDNDAREQLAMVYADEYSRVDLAIHELEELIEAPRQPQREIVRWLNLIADLQIKSGQEEAAIRQTLERITEKFPDTAAAENAETRMAFLSSHLKARTTSAPIRMGAYEQNVGLKGNYRGRTATPED